MFVYMNVCTYVFVRMYVVMYVGINICVCVCVYTYVSMHVSMYVCMYVERISKTPQIPNRNKLPSLTCNEPNSV